MLFFFVFIIMMLINAIKMKINSWHNTTSRNCRSPCLCCHTFLYRFTKRTHFSPIISINYQSVFIYFCLLKKDWIKSTIVACECIQSVSNNAINSCCGTPVITSDFSHPGALMWWGEADVSGKCWPSSTCTELQLVCITSERRLVTVRLCSIGMLINHLVTDNLI